MKAQAQIHRLATQSIHVDEELKTKATILT